MIIEQALEAVKNRTRVLHYIETCTKSGQFFRSHQIYRRSLKMDVKETESRSDKLNFEILAQIYTIVNDKTSKKHKALEKVLQKDFDVNYSVPSSKCALPNIAGRTALDFALDKRELEVFQMLIARGADFTRLKQSGNTVLHQIIEKSYVKNKPSCVLKGKLKDPFVETVLLAHIKCKNATNPHNESGISHLHIACMFNHTEAVEFFLAQGACVNQQISQHSKDLPGYAPLHLAARYSALETASLLLDYNADVNLKDAQGIYPLQLLIQRNIEILDWVRVQKQELSKELKDELLNNKNMIKLLLEKTKNNVAGVSLCHLACILQDTQMLNQLIMEGKVDFEDTIDANSLLWPGYKALHFAAICNINALKLLLTNGADILTGDVNGITPLDLCLERYSPKALHSIIAIVPQMNNITFENTGTKLTDLILAMSEQATFEHFLKNTVKSINISLPLDSQVWPGYAILHIAVILMDKIYGNKDPYRNSDYANGHQDLNSYSIHEEKQYFKRIRLCLIMGADVTITNACGSTPLHIAFRQQNRHVVRLLLKYHQRLIDVADCDNLSHLHIACTSDGNSIFVEKLLETARVNVNRQIKSAIDYVVPDDHDIVYGDDVDSQHIVLHIIPGWTPLHIAISTSSDDIVWMLDRHGGDFNVKDIFKMTPMHHLLRSGSLGLDCNSYLPQNCKDYETSFGLTYLHVACSVGNISAVKKLLEDGANIEARVNYNKVASSPSLSFLASFDGYTPLHFSLMERHFPIVKLLVERGANLFTKSNNGSIAIYEVLKTSFHSGYFSKKDGTDCYYSGCEEEYEYDDDDEDDDFTFALKLFNHKKIKKLIKKDSGITKLHIACMGIRNALVTALLMKKADPNVQIHMDSPIWPGYTPLHVLLSPRFDNYDDDDDDYNLYYVYKGIKNIGRSLLRFGASILLEDAHGNTPVHKVPELLWPDYKKPDNDDRNTTIDYVLSTLRGSSRDSYAAHHDVIYSAKTSHNDEGVFSIDWILDGLKDFSVNPVDAGGISHFHVACMINRIDAVKKFLKQGVDINGMFGHFTDRFGGFTPLHLASFYKSEDVVKVLSEKGADPVAKDFLGNTPLHTASVYCRLGHNGDRSNNLTIHKLLLKSGADADARNLWNEAPSEVALRMDEPIRNELLDVLLKYTCRVNIFNLVNEKGMLGLALQSSSILSSCVVESRCCYQKISSAQDLNNTDEKGRTVIHNVVSVNKPVQDGLKNGSVENYTHIIYKFAMLDIDIDSQDSEGQTALHKAARFGNYNAMVGLLMNGADIDILDADKKLAFAYTVQRGEENVEHRRKALKLCLLHACKLQIAGIAISNETQDLIAQIRNESVSCDSEIQLCSNELENMKNCVLDQSYSINMYNFLAETMSYFRVLLFLRDTIDKIFTNITSLRQKYPQFAGLLQMQYRNIFIRIQLIDSAKSALNLLARCPMPDVCSEIIFKSLNNRDLKQLIATTDFS